MLLVAAVLSQAALFETLLADTAKRPAAVLERAAELRAAPWREQVERQAFFALASADPRAAHLRIGPYLDRAWIAELPFPLALEQAYALEPAPGRRLLLAAARRQPSAALREAATCLRFAYGAAVLEAAAAEAPAEAAQLLTGRNANAEALRPFVRHTNPRTAPFLARGLAGPGEGIGPFLDAYRADPSAYWRRAAEPEAAAFYRQIHEHGRAPLGALTPAQRLTLAVFAHAEEDYELLPALLPEAEVPALPAIVLRRVMALAAARGRMAVFDRPALVARAVTDLATIEEAVDAAVILAASSSPAPPLGDSLFARLLTDPAPADRLALGESIIERFVFPNDDDGVESFDNFRTTYAQAAGWTWSEQEGVVEIRSPGETPRIRIFANVPVDIVRETSRREEVEARQERLTARLPRAPEVLVHRGHDYHVPRTVPFIPRTARLVFLGSCHGTDTMESIVAAAPAAHVIATRGIGTMGVNDPFLYALNRHLLAHDGAIDWRPFWRELAASPLGAHGLFKDYIAPPDNAAARLLGRYFAYLASL